MQTEIIKTEKQIIDDLFKANRQLGMGLAEASKYLPPYASLAVAKAMSEVK